MTACACEPRRRRKLKKAKAACGARFERVHDWSSFEETRIAVSQRVAQAGI
jgi:hypothetical protein